MRKDKYFYNALSRIKEIFVKMNCKGVAYLFGSSVREDYLNISDIDIAVISPDKKMINLLRYEIEELNIPYKVDLTDLREAGEN